MAGWGLGVVLAAAGDFSLGELLALLDRGGTDAVLLLLVWALLTGRLVPVRYYDRERERGDKWERVATSGLAAAERATDTAQRLASSSPSGEVA